MLSVDEKWERHRDYMRIWRARVGSGYMATIRNRTKVVILTHYGEDKCACVMCGESRLACLSIDHINGNGAYARKTYHRSGNNIYSWLKKENFPKGYQTLCMNCQFCKVVLDRSHKKETE